MMEEPVKPRRDPDEPKQTPLIEEHRRLGGRLIEFAGWRLPVWYTSVAEEHAAVRNAAGLFDIAHMGVLEITGADAAGFLDAATTAWASKLKTGRGRYTFVLDTDGLPVDDIIIYRLAEDRFLAVVNAANAEKVTHWLRDVAQGRIDSGDVGEAYAPGAVEIRDLSAEDAGEDQRVLLALQGPVSTEILCDLAAGSGCPAEKLRRFEITGAKPGGLNAMISRTGYTGEEFGFELLVHPDAAEHLWRRILEVGEKHGALPAGLGARDSLRIEAGLPLFGHEIAGPHEISPIGAGYGAFVALDKPFFIGRERLLEREEKRDHQISRFRVDTEGVRAIRAGDPVASGRGDFAGFVTSCALVGRRQVGMAWVAQSAGNPGAELLLYPARQLERAAHVKAAGDLAPGDRLPIHVSATVLPRFDR